LKKNFPLDGYKNKRFWFCRPLLAGKLLILLTLLKIENIYIIMIILFGRKKDSNWAGIVIKVHILHLTFAVKVPPINLCQTGPKILPNYGIIHTKMG